MSRRSAISARAVLRHAAAIAAQPWVVRPLLALQIEKWLFDWLPRDRRSGTAGRIRQVSLRLTDLCNLRCATCGQWGDGGFLHGRNLRDLRKDEVPATRYVEVLDDLVRRGHRPLLYLWGGEPMLYPGTLDLVEAATRLRLPTSIATNGTGIAKAAERLAAAPLFLLQVSVDGPTAEIHNRLRPSAGGGDNFADVTAGIRAVRAARAARGTALPLIATLTTISRGNAGSLAAIYERFRAEADLMVFYLAWWIDEPAALAHEREFGRRFGFTPVLHRGWLRTDRPDDWETLDREIARVERAAAHSGGAPAVFLPRIAGAEDLKAYYTDHARTFGFDRCISIFQAVEVNSNGDVSPCRDYHDYVVGNLREQTLADLWNCGRYRAFRTSLTREGLMPACTRCCGLMGY